MIYLVQQYFSESAKRFPDSVAIACREERVTYRDLDLQTNALARHLRESGLSRGSFVPVFIDKGINAIKAILAILKADCAYVPLDTGSPAARLSGIFDDTKAGLVLVDHKSIAAFRERCPDESRLTLLNVDEPIGAADTPLEYSNISIDVAYTLFTSGSTGKPKGVMISHQMIIDYIEWCVETYELGHEDVIANHAPLYFDNSTFDIYTAFKCGASLHLVHDELNLLLTRMIPWLRDRKITCFFCVPSVLTILLKSGKLVAGALPSLRHIIAAGEVLPPPVLREWMDLVPGAQFTNMYGPTEITVDCTFHVVAERPPEGQKVVPIGKPRTNMEVFVQLKDGRLCTDPGSEGELVVRGNSVSYGYLGDPERTRAAFFQNPRHNLFPDLLYRTGDIARIDDDGSFIFVGRRDDQIKYMGNRIELGEIESVIQGLDGVMEIAVVFNDSAVTEDKCIGALVRLGPDLTKESMLSSLKQLLPGYMVPRRVLAVEEVPKTSNGKIDRRAALGLVFPNA